MSTKPIPTLCDECSPYTGRAATVTWQPERGERGERWRNLCRWCYQLLYDRHQRHQERNGR